MLNLQLLLGVVERLPNRGQRDAMFGAERTQNVRFDEIREGQRRRLAPRRREQRSELANAASGRVWPPDEP
jgi:hypothetical protein